MNTTFIHTADFHLGKDFLYAGMDMELAGNRKSALWTTLENVFAMAKNNNAVVFISGDLFDHRPKAYELYRFVELTECYADVDVYVIDGNHDQGMCHALSEMLSDESRVCVFHKPGIHFIEDKMRNLRVYGTCYDPMMDLDNELQKLELDDAYTNILLLHTSLDRPGSRYMPTTVQILESTNFHYIALGHVHNYEWIYSRARYAGTPEPLNFREEGSHGVVMGELGREEDSSFVRMSRIEFRTLNVELDAKLAPRQMEAMLVKTLENFNENIFLRLVLHGEIAREVSESLCEFIRHANFRVHILDIKNKTHAPSEDDDALIEAFHEVLNQLQDEDKEEIRSLGIEAIQRGRECENKIHLS